MMFSDGAGEPPEGADTIEFFGISARKRGKKRSVAMSDYEQEE
jgi:hypothetical protein